MSSLFAGPTAITPWIERAVVERLLPPPHGGGGGGGGNEFTSSSSSSSFQVTGPKLVQIISFSTMATNNDCNNNNNNNDGGNGHGNNDGDCYSKVMVSDGGAFMDAYLTPAVHEHLMAQTFQRGCTVRLGPQWTLTTTRQLFLQNTMPSNEAAPAATTATATTTNTTPAAWTFCLKIVDPITIIGTRGVGTMGNPMPIQACLQVRRAMATLDNDWNVIEERLLLSVQEKETDESNHRNEAAAGAMKKPPPAATMAAATAAALNSPLPAAVASPTTAAAAATNTNDLGPKKRPFLGNVAAFLGFGSGGGGSTSISSITGSSNLNENSINASTAAATNSTAAQQQPQQQQHDNANYNVMQQQSAITSTNEVQDLFGRVLAVAAQARQAQAEYLQESQQSHQEQFHFMSSQYTDIGHNSQDDDDNEEMEVHNDEDDAQQQQQQQEPHPLGITAMLEVESDSEVNGVTSQKPSQTEEQHVTFAKTHEGTSASQNDEVDSEMHMDGKEGDEAASQASSSMVANARLSSQQDLTEMELLASQTSQGENIAKEDKNDVAGNSKGFEIDKGEEASQTSSMVANATLTSQQDLMEMELESQTSQGEEIVVDGKNDDAAHEDSNTAGFEIDKGEEASQTSSMVANATLTSQQDLTDLETELESQTSQTEYLPPVANDKDNSVDVTLKAKPQFTKLNNASQTATTQMNAGVASTAEEEEPLQLETQQPSKDIMMATMDDSLSNHARRVAPVEGESSGKQFVLTQASEPADIDDTPMQEESSQEFFTQSIETHDSGMDQFQKEAEGDSVSEQNPNKSESESRPCRENAQGTHAPNSNDWGDLFTQPVPGDEEKNTGLTDPGGWVELLTQPMVEDVAAKSPLRNSLEGGLLTHPPAKKVDTNIGEATPQDLDLDATMGTLPRNQAVAAKSPLQNPLEGGLVVTLPLSKLQINLGDEAPQDLNLDATMGPLPRKRKRNIWRNASNSYIDVLLSESCGLLSKSARTKSSSPSWAGDRLRTMLNE